jgi:hypothetical protein
VYLSQIVKSHPALVEYGGGRRIELLHFDTKMMDQPKGFHHAG